MPEIVGLASAIFLGILVVTSDVETWGWRTFVVAGATAGIMLVCMVLHYLEKKAGVDD